MRTVLFALRPFGAGCVYRDLSIARHLRHLFPAIEPIFAAAGSAKTLLEKEGVVPVVSALSAIVPRVEENDPRASGLAVVRRTRSMAPSHAREVVRASRLCSAELVVVDQIPSAPPQLSRSGIPCIYLTDDLHDGEEHSGTLRRLRAAWTRRAIVGSTALRFFIGDPSELSGPEMRVFARKHFRFTGAMSGLSWVRRRECALLRDELPIGSKRLMTIYGGNGLSAGAFQSSLAAACQLLEETQDLVVHAFAGDHLRIDLENTPAGMTLHSSLEATLCRWFAISDVCVIPASKSALAECSGSRVPTLCLPRPADPREERNAVYHRERHQVPALFRDEQTPEAILKALRELLSSQVARPKGPGFEEQQRSSESVADLIAEFLGRKRPTAKG